MLHVVDHHDAVAHVQDPADWGKEDDPQSSDDDLPPSQLGLKRESEARFEGERGLEGDGGGFRIHGSTHGVQQDANDDGVILNG